MTTSYGKRSQAKRIPYIAQVIVGVEGGKCPHCECPVPGIIATWATDQHFDPSTVDLRAICQSCEEEFKPAGDVQVHTMDEAPASTPASPAPAPTPGPTPSGE